MMNKIIEFASKPITWKDYGKLMIWATIISLIVGGIEWIYFMGFPKKLRKGKYSIVHSDENDFEEE